MSERACLCVWLFYQLFPRSWCFDGKRGVLSPVDRPPDGRQDGVGQRWASSIASSVARLQALEAVAALLTQLFFPL